MTAPVDAASVNTHRGPPQLSTTVAKPQQFGVIVVGGGSAGGHAVEGLREAGYEGSILVVMKEPHLPIDRTKLSKALISDPKKVALRDDIFYQALDVTFELSSEVSSFDSAANTIKLSDGTIRSYDHLILATGSVASRLPESMLKGLKNVFTMRCVSIVILNHLRVLTVVSYRIGQSKTLQRLMLLLARMKLLRRMLSLLDHLSLEWNSRWRPRSEQMSPF